MSLSVHDQLRSMFEMKGRTLVELIDKSVRRQSVAQHILERTGSAEDVTGQQSRPPLASRQQLLHVVVVEDETM